MDQQLFDMLWSFAILLSILIIFALVFSHFGDHTKKFRFINCAICEKPIDIHYLLFMDHPKSVDELRYSASSIPIHCAECESKIHEYKQKLRNEAKTV